MRFAASGTYMTGPWLIGRRNDRRQKAKQDAGPWLIGRRNDRRQKAKQDEEEASAVTALGKTV